MAVMDYAAGTTTCLHRSYHRFTSETLNYRKPILLISSSFTSFPANPTRRKNHLRQKILKTLERPIIPKFPLSNPIIPVDSPPLQEKEYNSGIIHEILEYDSEAGNEEVQKFEELREIEISKPAGLTLVRSEARNSILNYGLWLVGAFVFQTVCAIWVFRSAGTDNKNQILNGTEKSSVLQVGENGEGESRVKFVLYGNGNGKMGVENSALDSIIYVDELEIKSKIEEIRVMATKAREMEILELKKNGLYYGEEMDGGIFLKNRIEIKVDDRLIKLRKNFEKARGKIPMAFVGYLSKQNETNDHVKKRELYMRDNNEDLLFKKKYRFKRESANLTKKPKGFVGSDDKSGKEKKGNGVVKPKVKDGIALEKNNGKKLNGEGVKSRKSSALDIAVVSDDLSIGNDSLEGKRAGDATSPPKTESGTDFWWFSLPYVLVIVMRRGNNGEGGEGFYTLKSISSTDDQISHMVAFEDRRDATNFCYLLQSFFEDLEDFNADVVPLPVKELNEAAKYYSTRAVVVRRGQLQLYAGQPLGDAEMALRAMI